MVREGTGAVTDDKPDFVDQLARLAALHESGALSDAEFDAGKAKMLGSAASQEQLGGLPSQLGETASERRHRLRYLSLVVSLVLVVVVVVVVILGGSATGHRPTAGLPLSVPAGPRVTVVEKPVGKVSAQSLQQAVRVMARRIYASGVRDFVVHTQGGDIVIELPRTKNEVEVLEVVGQTGQLFFRPVECIIAPYVGTTASTTSRAPTTRSATSLTPEMCSLTAKGQEHYLPPQGNRQGVTPAAFDTAGAIVVLADNAPYYFGRYVLGPAEMNGSIIKTATANLNSQTDEWELDISFTAAGSTLLNKYAARHYQCYVQNDLQAVHRPAG
jgi:hypothetical protein